MNNNDKNLKKRTKNSFQSNAEGRMEERAASLRTQTKGMPTGIAELGYAFP